MLILILDGYFIDDCILRVLILLSLVVGKKVAYDMRQYQSVSCLPTYRDIFVKDLIIPLCLDE